MNKNFFQIMYLLFIARQGYWSNDTEVSKKSLFKLTYIYILIGGLLVLFLLPFRTHFRDFMESLHYFEMISYYLIIIYGLYIIISIGIVYENYHIIKSNTINSLLIFFNTNKKQLLYLIYIRNIVIIFPALVFLTFFECIRPWLIFTVVHFSSLFTIKKIFHLIGRKQTHTQVLYVSKFVVYARYIYSGLGLAFFMKSTLIPIISLSIFAIVQSFYGDIVTSLTFLNDFLSGVLIGAIIFQSKHYSFAFLCLNQDLPFFKTLGISVPKFTNNVINILNLIQVFSVLISLLLWNLFYFHWLVNTLVPISVGMILSFYLINTNQLMLAKELRKYKFKEYYELEAFKLPLRQHIPRYFMNAYVTTIVIIGNISANEHSSVGLFLIIVVSLLLPAFYQWDKYQQILKEI